MTSVEPSHSINSVCVGCAPPTSSIIAPSAKTSPAVAIGRATAAVAVAECSLPFIVRRYLSFSDPATGSPFTSIGQKKMPRMKLLRGIACSKTVLLTTSSHARISTNYIFTTPTLSTRRHQPGKKARNLTHVRSIPPRAFLSDMCPAP
jgi:hypothetical protein